MVRAGLRDRICCEDRGERDEVEVSKDFRRERGREREGEGEDRETELWHRVCGVMTSSDII